MSLLNLTCAKQLESQIKTEHVSESHSTHASSLSSIHLVDDTTYVNNLTTTARFWRVCATLVQNLKTCSVLVPSFPML